MPTDLVHTRHLEFVTKFFFAHHVYGIEDSCVSRVYHPKNFVYHLCVPRKNPCVTIWSLPIPLPGLCQSETALSRTEMISPNKR